MSKLITISLIFLSLIVSGFSKPSYAEEMSLTEIVLQDREQYTVYNLPKIYIEYNRAIDSSDLDNFPIKKAFGDIINIDVSIDDQMKIVGRRVSMANNKEVLIYLSDEESLLKGRSWRSLTRLSGLYSVTELGSTKLPFGSKRFAERVGREYGNTIFQKNIIPSICSSAYVNDFSRATNNVVKAAQFFVEDTKYKEACVRMLFLDFLGLRKLAISTDELDAHDMLLVEEMINLDNGTEFSN